MFYFFFYTILAPVVKFLWIKEARGLDNIPREGGAILASNHESFLDPILIGAVSSRRVYYVVGERIFDRWWLKWIFQMTGQIRVDRLSKARNAGAIRKCLQVLRDEQLLCIFPEGSLRRGRVFRKSYTGVARLALLSRKPVIPVSIKGAYELFPWHKRVPRFAKEATVVFGTPMFFAKYYGREQDESVMKEVMGEVMQEIGRLCGGECGGGEVSQETSSHTTRYVMRLDKRSG